MVKIRMFAQVLKYMKTKSAEAERERQRELEREKGSVLLLLILLWKYDNMYLFRATETGGRGENAKSQRGKETEGRA